MHASDWGREFLFSQQDIDEFKRHFFEEVEKLNKDILNIFQVESVSTVHCKDVDYRNEIVTTSLEIELNIMGQQKQPIDNVGKSMRLLCSEEQLESDVDTELYGKHVGFKTLRFAEVTARVVPQPQALRVRFRADAQDNGEIPVQKGA